MRTSRQLGYRCTVRTFNRRQSPNRQENNFILAQQGQQRHQQNNGCRDTIPGRDGLLHESITCYACGNTRHYAEQCTEINGTNIFQASGAALTVRIIITQRDGTIKNS